MGSESVEVLYLARLEETGSEKEKPDPTWDQTHTNQVLEPDTDGRLGNGPKPDPGHNHHTEKADEKGVPIRTRFLQESFPTV